MTTICFPHACVQPTIDHVLPACRVALTLGVQWCMIDFVELFRRQLNVDGGDVLFEPLALCSAGNRHDPWFLREQPGKRDLGRRRVLTITDVTQHLACPGRLSSRCVAPTILKPNLVAVDTSSQNGANASPTSSSLTNGP
jgi:hypothetical protein